ncbi:hypothetical protein CO663_08240 [Rhizobium anhuiense]|nr:hypothetical protein CO663_08240 [Rhizobium anhuiense]
MEPEIVGRSRVWGAIDILCCQLHAIMLWQTRNEQEHQSHLTMVIGLLSSGRLQIHYALLDVRTRNLNLSHAPAFDWVALPLN